MNHSRGTSQAGLTLVEIMLVVVIVGILVAIVSVSISAARSKGFDAQRYLALKDMQLALELYYRQNGSYPVTPISGRWYTPQWTCSWAVRSQTNYIPGLSPTYMKELPQDPKPTACGTGYLYMSNGTDYKLIAHIPDKCESPDMRSVKDPARDGGSNNSTIDGNACWAWAVYTPGWASQ